MALAMRTTRPNRQSDGALSAPVAAQSGTYRTLRYPRSLRPCRNAQSFISDCKKFVGTNISSLLSFGDPTDVARLVMTVIIFAIDRVFSAWSATDSFEKMLKRRKAKLNTAPTIILESWTVGIGASLFRRSINAIFRRPLGLQSFTVSDRAGAEEFGCQAPARSLVLQFISTYFTYLSTGAFAPPTLSVTPFTRIAKNGQAVAKLSCQVYERATRWNRLKNNSIFSVGHDVFSLIENRLARLAKDSQGLWRAVFILPNIKRICISNMQEVAISH